MGWKADTIRNIVRLAIPWACKNAKILLFPPCCYQLLS